MKPNITRSACSCFAVRRSLRDLLASVFSQPGSFSAKRSSLLGRSGVANFGSTKSAARYFLTPRHCPRTNGGQWLDPRQTSPPHDLPYRQLLPQRHSPDDVQKSHVDHSIAPRRTPLWGKGHMGQISMEIMCLLGSVPSGNQQSYMPMSTNCPAPVFSAWRTAATMAKAIIMPAKTSPIPGPVFIG